MKIEVLGCSGGVGKGLKTTTFLVDERILLDAGTGVELLTLEQMLAIRHVFITHAHLDHIAGLPLMLATIYDKHRAPIDLYALPAVVQALKTHIFNWTVWPDYSQLPAARPILRLHTLDVGQVVTLENKEISVVPAEHPTPTVGYLIRHPTGSRGFLFTGDSGPNAQLLPTLHHYRPELLIIDVSFTDEMGELAGLSGHLTPSQLARQLAALGYQPRVRISHLKPGHEERIMQQCRSLLPALDLDRLQQGETIHLQA